MAVALGTQRLDHLGLVAGMYEELGIGEFLDETILQDQARRGVSVGQAVKAMVLNGLGFAHRALYLTPQFFKNRPTERLIGPGILPEHLNDDTLGRALDALYKHDVTLLFALISAQAARRLGLHGGVAHLDSTSFHLDGDYTHDNPPEAGVVHLTPGYSRDHRPELNQVVLNLIVEHRARLPLWMQPSDGNSNDTKSFGQIVEQHIDQLQAEHGIVYWVADSALYSAANLQRLSAHRAKWITRVPETLNLAQDPLERLAGQGALLTPGYLGQTVEVAYAGVRQRWLVVTSLAALQCGVKRVDQQLSSDSEAELKAWLKLTRQGFACETDARRALERFQRDRKLLKLAQPEVVAVRKHQTPGRPVSGTEPMVVSYRLVGAPYLNSNLRLTRLVRKSSFILATNELDSTQLSDVALLETYKGQQTAERGFKFLKDPMFQADTLYLKSPQRIMALLMVMTLCLLVYAALEHRLCRALADAQQTFPDQKGKPAVRPTLRWVFQYFTGLDVLLIPDQPPRVLNLDDHHRLVSRLLGPPYEYLYS